jgi:hypothetical protein
MTGLREAPMHVPGFPEKAISSAPGQLGPGGAASVMIFDVGHGMLDTDLVTRFFDEDADGLEWVRDFLCDPAMDRTIERLVRPEDEEEEFEVPEELYSRSETAQFGAGTFDET